MSRRKMNPGRRCNRESGMALMVLVFMIAISLTAFTFKYFNAQSGKLAQQDATAAALAEAKAALIGAALMDATVPGRLPCPEDTAKIGTMLEGDALSSCNTPASRIGRLPWRTLGLGKLVDGHGEPLWYALSNNFRAAPINSETIPQLSLDGVANAAVAIIFSAGPALAGQDRPAITSGSPPLQANFLDQGNADADATFFRAVSSSSFNDQLIVISHADLFEPLEKRVLGEIRNNTSPYKDTWHAYPFPVGFTNPATLNNAAFIGDTSESGGLLPVADPTVAANLAVSNIVINPILGTVSNATCTIVNPGNVTTERLQCSAQLSPLFNFFYATGTVQFGFSNVGKAFVKPNVLATGDFLTSSTSTTYTVGLNSVTQSIDAAANGMIRVPFTIFNNFSSSATTTIRISIRISDYPDLMDDWTLSASSWLIQNNWHRLIYYRVADPFRPAGNSVTPTCSGNCLSLRRTFANGATQTSTNIPGVIMTAGKSLASTDFQATPSQTRPSAQLKEYFDSTDHVAAETTLTFDQILPLKSTFNDQIRTLQP